MIIININKNYIYSILILIKKELKKLQNKKK